MLLRCLCWNHGVLSRGFSAFPPVYMEHIFATHSCKGSLRGCLARWEKTRHVIRTGSLLPEIPPWNRNLGCRTGWGSFSHTYYYANGSVINQGAFAYKSQDGCCGAVGSGASIYPAINFFSACFRSATVTAGLLLSIWLWSLWVPHMLHCLTRTNSSQPAEIKEK